MSVADVLDRVKKLEPEIRERAGEIEQGRRVPRDLVDTLAAAGCFDLCVPASFGGVGATLAESLAVFDELCRIDGSVGWVVMIGATAPQLLSYLPSAAFDLVYGNGPAVHAGGTLAPKGRAAVEGDGYRVTGRWPFASGCEHCDWLIVHCLVTENDEMRMAPAGGPELKMLLLARDDVEIIDTWHVAGLKGTGSHDIAVSDVFVPAERAGSLFGGAATIDSTLFRIPVLCQFSMTLASCAIGIARGALAGAVELAVTKRPSFKPGQRVAEDPVARFELGRADVLLTAATSLVQSQAEQAWNRAERDVPWTDIDRVRMRACGWQATRLATEVVELAYTAGGGTALYETSDLQRRLRDVHAVTQHAGVGRDTVTWLGGFLTGEPVPDARL